MRAAAATLLAVAAAVGAPAFAAEPELQGCYERRFRTDSKSASIVCFQLGHRIGAMIGCAECLDGRGEGFGFGCGKYAFDSDGRIILPVASLPRQADGFPVPEAMIFPASDQTASCRLERTEASGVRLSDCVVRGEWRPAAAEFASAGDFLCPSR